MELNGFELFTGANRARVSAPVVSIQNRGGFSLNGPAFEAMGRPDAVLLLFNPQQQKVALKSVPEGTPHAVRVRPAGKGHTHVISALPFLRANGVDYEGTPTRGLITKVENGVAILDLKGSPDDVSE